MNCLKSIFLNAMICVILKEKAWTLNLLMLNSHLMHTTMNNSLKKDEDSGNILSIPPLEGGEEVKERKRIKILTLKILLTRVPVLFAQIKAGNTSYKLKNEIRQRLYPQIFYPHYKH